MKFNFLINSKSSGLCFNIMRLIILTWLANQTHRRLIFLTKEDHIPILKKFNKRAAFIPYTKDHTKMFNNFTRKRKLNPLYDLKYIKYINDNYIKDLLGGFKLSDYKFICGNIDKFYPHDDKIIIMDYNDGNKDADVLNCMSLSDFKVDSNLFPYDESFTTVNIKINDPDNKRIYDFWDEIIPELKKEHRKLLLISGNNEIKKYFGNKYQCIYRETLTEVNYSNVRGNDIPRGKPSEIFNDLIVCSLTNFITFEKIRGRFPDICSKYADINFVREKVEKFDILAKFLSKYIKAQ